MTTILDIRVAGSRCNDLIRPHEVKDFINSACTIAPEFAKWFLSVCVLLDTMRDYCDEQEA